MLQDVIRPISISTYFSPLAVNGSATSAGMLAMTIRVRGMSASPTISARVRLIVLGATGREVMVMVRVLLPIPLLRPPRCESQGMLQKVLQMLRKVGNSCGACANMAYAWG